MDRKSRKFRRFSRTFIARIHCSPASRRKNFAAANWRARRRFYWTRCSRARKTSSSKARSCASPSHRVALKQDEDAAAGKIEESVSPWRILAVPSTPEVLAKSGVEPRALERCCKFCCSNRKLVRVGEELIYPRLRASTRCEDARARKGARFSVAEFKEWTGVSRKYAIPLLEFLDREQSRAARANNA